MKHPKIVRLIGTLIVFIVVHSIGNLAMAQVQSVNQNDLVFKSTDGGATWQSLIDFDKNPIGRQVKKIVLDPLNSATIYLVTNKGVFKSTDSGGSWNDSNNGLTDRFINDLVIDRENPLNLYLTTPADITTHSGGLYKSSDAGRTWQSIPLLFEAPPAYQIGNSYLTPTALAISPLNPSRIYVGARGIEYVVFYRSANGANSLNASTVAFSLDYHISYIVVDPQNPATAYRGLNDNAISFKQSSLEKTTDGGESWMPVYDRNAGFDTSNLSLVINPQNSNILYNIVRDDLDHNVFTNKSTDGGSTWSTITDPILTGLLVIDPNNPLNFYALRFNSLYKSINDGESWQLTSLPPTISTLTIDPTNSLTLYAGNLIPNPAILSVSIEGKNLIVSGKGFHAGVSVKIDGEIQKTKRDANRPNEVLICKKAAKKIAPGQKVSITVQEIDGLSTTFDFTR